MNRLLVRLIPAVSLLLMLGGCEEVTSQPWSTKSDSLQFPLVVSPVLAVSPAVTADATPAGLREASIELLVQACDSTYPLLRANALEAMQAAPDEIEPLIRRGLVDENRAVRFIATMSIGQMQLKSLAHLTEPLLRDESLSVQAAAIFALARTSGSWLTIISASGFRFARCPQRCNANIAAACTDNDSSRSRGSVR